MCDKKRSGPEKKVQRMLKFISNVHVIETQFASDGKIEEIIDNGLDYDDLVEEADAYLVSKKYPECVSGSKKRVLQRMAAKLTLSAEGKLLYKHKQGKVQVIAFNTAIIVFAIFGNDLYVSNKVCHIDSTSGHMGKTRTLYRIEERFLWHGMVKDVVSLVSSLINYYSVFYIYISNSISGSAILLQLSKCDVCHVLCTRASQNAIP